LGQDGQVNVQPDPVDAPHPEREHRPLVLQDAELALHRAALVVEGLRQPRAFIIPGSESGTA